MSQASCQDSFTALVNLGNSLIHSSNELDRDELQKKVIEYTRKMKSYFLALKSRKAAEQNMEELAQLMLNHEKITAFFNKEKEKLSRKLKNLHVGKAMKNTYPEGSNINR